jgi:hypothetical protein
MPLGSTRARWSPVTRPTTSWASPYKRSATAATIANNGLDKATVKSWVANYGSKVWSSANAGVKGYTPAANSHFDILDTSRAASKEIKKATAKCLLKTVHIIS